MNNSIAYIVLSILALCFLIGSIIIIRNAIKIEGAWRLLKKKLKDENRIKLAHINSELQKKLRPLIPKPTLSIPVSANKMKMIN